MAQDEYKFERLTPTDDVNIQVYEEAIDVVFKNSDIKNVAISGAYGAGKSSVLASYKKKHSDIKFLHISLAHFNSENTSNDIDNVKETDLEGKILNQLIHQLPTNKIPQTQFKVKQGIKAFDILWNTGVIVLLIILSLYFIFNEDWENLISALPTNNFKFFLQVSIHPYFTLLMGALLIILMSFLIYQIVRIQKDKNIFRKLSIQGNEIEIFEDSEDSYFDKYLNEVLYLFENADTDVIVFEDMDRFENNTVFERLREVNTLVNIRFKRRKGEKVLRFFYLIRDDIFITKDRTKFFDYIVPIIPVVDSSNSYDKLIDLFRTDDLFEKFDKNFLSGVSLYIDDMRLLKNIYNEFLIYYYKLNITELNYNKMLAIIIYKNLFPKDFADLQLNQGFVYTLFASKNIFISQTKTKLEEEIKMKEDRLKLAKEEHLQSLKELKFVFDNLYSSYISRNSEYFTKYQQRARAIDDKLNGTNIKLEAEIYNLKNELMLLEGRALKEIITRDNIETIFTYPLKNSNEQIVKKFQRVVDNNYFDLLKYLLRNGYIDETYQDYMTYFYENSLKISDKIFLRSVTDKKAKEYDYKLVNPELIVSRLKLDDFNQEETLNYDLLTYLLQIKKFNYAYMIIDQLKFLQNYKFIIGFLDSTPQLPDFVRALNDRWPDMFFVAWNNKKLTDQQLHDYSVYLLYYLDDDVIKVVNKDNCLTEYISKSKSFLNINDPDIEKLVQRFKLLKVCFEGFDYDEVNLNLFNAVYNDSLYLINSENIVLILEKKMGAKDKNSIMHSSYTIIRPNQDAAFTQYVENNINEYVKTIISMSAGEINDSSTAVSYLLNNENLELSLKKDYIECLSNIVLESISDIKVQSLWKGLVEKGLVAYSEKNILDYFEQFGLDETLVTFINQGQINRYLDFSPTNYGESMIESFITSIISCKSINKNRYEQILKSSNYHTDQFDIADIATDKINILISLKAITMTQDNLIFMRDTYPEQVLTFISANIDIYVEIMDPTMIRIEELKSILTWNINDDLKLSLLEYTDVSISIIGKKYSDEICTHILEHNLDKADLPYLYSSYDEYGQNIRLTIYKLATKNMTDIIKRADTVSDLLINELLLDKNINIGTKIDLLIAMLPNMKYEVLNEMLVKLDLKEYLKLFVPHSKPKIQNTPRNQKLLNALLKYRFIKGFTLDSDSNYFKVQKNRSLINN